MSHLLNDRVDACPHCGNADTVLYYDHKRSGNIDKLASCPDCGMCGPSKDDADTAIRLFNMIDMHP